MTGETYFVGKSQVDGSNKRKVEMPDGKFIETTLLRVGEFDVVSINCFAFENQWLFLFARNEDLPRTKKYSDEYNKHILSSLVEIRYPPLQNSMFNLDLFSLLDQIIIERKGQPVSDKQEFIVETKGGEIIVAEE